MISKPTRIRRAGPPGFALVVTVSLMVLLALLAVGLLSLSTVSLRASSKGAAQAEARANARLALALAIGQLQKTAGPDQRVTTTADQWTEAGGDGAESSAAEENRHWTGVYRAWPAETEQRPQPEFVSWLVSGQAESAARQETAGGETADPVVLVDRGTLGDAPSGRVTVPALAVADERGAARLGWWTGDQGVKAVLDIPETSEARSPAEIRASLQAARQMGVQLAADGSGRQPFAELETDDARRRLVTDWPQSAFLADDPALPRGLFHDLAASSSGMLTNVRAGGFRKDLSMYLEREPSEAPIEPLYEIDGRAGINFAELWLYYQVYKDLQSGRRLAFTTGGSSSTDTPFFEIDGSLAAVSQDHAILYKQPTLISYKSVLSFHARTVNTSNGPKKRLAVVCDPIITYWNPLDVPVSLQPAYNSVKFWQLPYDLTLTVGGRTVTTSLRRALAASSWHFLTLIAGKVQPIVLKPGEVLVYSQAANTTIRRYNPGLNYVDGKAGWNLGGGVAVDLRDPSGGYIEGDPNDIIRYRIRPNDEVSRGSRHFSLTDYGLYYKEDRSSRGQSLRIGSSTIDGIYGDPYSSSSPKPDAYRLVATQAPQVFDKFNSADTRPLTFARLDGRKEPFMLHAHNAKTEFGSDRGGRWLARHNPKSTEHDFGTLSEEELDLLPFEIQVEPLDGWKNRNLEVSPDGNGFFGGGMNAEFGTNFLVTHFVPRQPVFSLAAFQHAFANGFDAGSTSSGSTVVRPRRPMLPQICHPIGNSLAPSVLPPEQTDGTLDGRRTLADHSYLANRALWDDWFLSGIAPDPQGRRTQSQVALDFLSGDRPLSVARYRLTSDSGQPDGLIDEWFDGDQPAADAHLLTAAALRVDGLFNVNSTSVEAWKAMFAALREHPVVTRDQSGAEDVTSSEESITPVANLVTSEDLIASGDGNVDVKDPAQWIGRRTLDDDEIDALARALVREIRKRGPFLSLADFINRRPGSERDLAAAGAVQSALDSEQAGINSAYVEGPRAVPDADANRYPFPEAEAGAAAYGAPGIVRQADILTPIAPMLSARSDSFVIRAYGESVSGGKVVARAWCEAVVERQAAFVSPQDEPNTAAADLVSDVNRRFGRRFELVSFRWLHPNEV
ncbi:hypothetical protein [Haloferula sp. A504]|uniref:hypothetical protein n=1 Tax=Haloferula sp. A504 TaxID=3373601 RepID=UPI0031C9EFB4|nr:hypothetical protein [Verrucomicrobiaceae bacterium E54]